MADGFFDRLFNDRTVGPLGNTGSVANNLYGMLSAPRNQGNAATLQPDAVQKDVEEKIITSGEKDRPTAVNKVVNTPGMFDGLLKGTLDTLGKTGQFLGQNSDLLTMLAAGYLGSQTGANVPAIGATGGMAFAGAGAAETIRERQKQERELAAQKELLKTKTETKGQKALFETLDNAEKEQIRNYNSLDTQIDSAKRILNKIPEDRQQALLSGWKSKIPVFRNKDEQLVVSTLKDLTQSYIKAKQGGRLSDADIALGEQIIGQIEAGRGNVAESLSALQDISDRGKKSFAQSISTGYDIPESTVSKTFTRNVAYAKETAKKLPPLLQALKDKGASDAEIEAVRKARGL